MRSAPSSMLSRQLCRIGTGTSPAHAAPGSNQTINPQMKKSPGKHAMNRPTLRRTVPMLALLLTTYCGGEQFDAKAPDVQFIDQYNPAGKDAHYNGTEYCGPAVLAGMAKARGLSGGLSDADLVNRLAQLAGTDPRSGTTGNGMIAALHSLGMRTDAVPGVDMEWIDNQLSSGHDII